MKPELPLQAGETLNWEGRPAPRCFTFRNWGHSLCGLVLLGFVGVWYFSGDGLDAAAGGYGFRLITLPFVLLGIWLVFGHLLAARLEWEGVWYAVTDRRILVRRGLLRRRWQSLELAELIWFRMNPHGAELATLILRGGDGGEKRLRLNCIEQPQPPAELLKAALQSNGYMESAE